MSFLSPLPFPWLFSFSKKPFFVFEKTHWVFGLFGSATAFPIDSVLLTLSGIFCVVPVDLAFDDGEHKPLVAAEVPGVARQCVVQHCRQQPAPLSVAQGLDGVQVGVVQADIFSRHCVSSFLCFSCLYPTTTLTVFFVQRWRCTHTALPRPATQPSKMMQSASQSPLHGCAMLSPLCTRGAFLCLGGHNRPFL